MSTHEIGSQSCGVDWTDADLRGVNLSGFDLQTAGLRGARLNGANLSGANLCGADLTGADLTGADLSGARLTFTDLRGANLRGAKLDHCQDLPLAYRDTETRLPEEVARLLAPVDATQSRATELSALTLFHSPRFDEDPSRPSPV
jgi:uncharacterized protein YjbI with pentapeptide repeats